MTLQGPTPASAPRYAFHEDEWHRIATGARTIPGYSTLTPAVTGCGLRVPAGAPVADEPKEPRCGCAGRKETP